MRRLLALLAALTLLLMMLPAEAESPPTATPLPGYTLLASPEELRVFATRSLKANLVGTISPDSNAAVEVLDVTGDWCYISFSTPQGTRCGYLPLSCFDVAPAATPTPAPQSSIPAGTAAWVSNLGTGYRLNLRQEPRILAKSEGKYFTGTPVTLTGMVDNGFAQVLVAGTALGWMDLRYLTMDAQSFVPELPAVTVKGTSAALRSGPGTSYPKVTRGERGTQLTVFGVRSDGWYHVQLGDVIGYVSESLLSGTFPFGYGMDSDNPSLSERTDQSSVFYINTRSTGEQLHLRKSAASNSKSMGLFYTGTPLSIISYTRTGWAYVRIGQTEGYMAAEYFTSEKPQQYGDIRTVQNGHATGLNLRESPSTGSALLSFAPNGTNVILLGELSNGWCYVDCDGTLGYMLSNGSLKPTY